MSEGVGALFEALRQKPNPFYVAKLGGNLSDDVGLEGCPFTTKAELVADHAEHPPFGSNLSEPLENYTRFHQTSGTSGEPMAWLDTEESWDSMLECWQIVYEQAGVDFGDDSAFFAFSFGPFLGFWTAFEAAARMGLRVIPAGGLSSAARVHLLRKSEATLLCCTPTYAMRLGEERERLGVKTSVHTLFVAGEAGGSIPETRAAIEALWPGAKVRDHHGMTETGPVTYAHPDRENVLCPIETHYCCEIIDPETHVEVCDGEVGELVLTTLKRTASPLVRYRSGDLVRKIRLEDGSLGFDGGILGRCDDMVVVRGVNIYPSALEGILRRFHGIAEYRVRHFRQRSMSELAVEIERVAGEGAERLSGGALEDVVEAALRDAFSLRIPVTLVEPGTLPRPEFKSSRWVKQV